MSQIPIVPIAESIVLPASQERVFDSIWISHLLVRTLAPTDQSGGGLVQIGYQPMSAATFETLPDVTTITSEQLMLAVSQVPEVAAAMIAILNAVQPLQAWLVNQHANE